MPTPSDDTRQLSSPALEHERSAHATCPPDNGRIEEWRTREDSHIGQDALMILSIQPQPQPQPVSLLEHPETIGRAETQIDQDAPVKMDDTDQDQSINEGQSPTSTATEAGDAESSSSPLPSTRLVTPSHSTSYELSNIRVTIH